MKLTFFLLSNASIYIHNAFLNVQRPHKQDQEQTTLMSSLELLYSHKEEYNSVVA